VHAVIEFLWQEVPKKAEIDSIMPPQRIHPHHTGNKLSPMCAESAQSQAHGRIIVATKINYLHIFSSQSREKMIEGNFSRIEGFMAVQMCL